MHGIKPFDKFIPLAQEELELPLFDVIQNLNWLITESLDQTHIAVFMEKYENVMMKLPEMQSSPVSCTDLLHNYFDQMFDRMVEYPISICPLTMISVWDLPPYVRQVWSVITACQILLPCVVACKKSLERQEGKRIPNTIIICVIDQYLKDKFFNGMYFVSEKLNMVFDDKAAKVPMNNVLKSDIYADILLNGFTRVSLLPTHHVNMLDVEKIVGDVVRSHPALHPELV